MVPRTGCEKPFNQLVCVWIRQRRRDQKGAVEFSLSSAKLIIELRPRPVWTLILDRVGSMSDRCECVEEPAQISLALHISGEQYGFHCSPRSNRREQKPER
jgi:hypothetical protein